MPPNQPPLNFPPLPRRVDFITPLLQAAQLKRQQEQLKATELFRKTSLDKEQQRIDILKQTQERLVKQAGFQRLSPRQKKLFNLFGRNPTQEELFEDIRKEAKARRAPVSEKEKLEIKFSKGEKLTDRELSLIGQGRKRELDIEAKEAALKKPIITEVNTIVDDALSQSRSEGILGGQGAVDLQKFIQIAPTRAAASSPEVQERVQKIVNAMRQTLLREGGARELGEADLKDAVNRATDERGNLDEDAFIRIIRQKRQESKSVITQAQATLKQIQQSSLTQSQKDTLISTVKQRVAERFPNINQGDLPFELRQ